MTQDIERRAIEVTAGLMALAARTAPKSRGTDYVVLEILYKEDLNLFADRMRAFGSETGKKNFDRDAAGVEASSAVVLIGLKRGKAISLDCGACGFPGCKELEAAARTEDSEFVGPQCAYRLLDLGIALGSAVKTASIMNADNRIMYRIGVVARKYGYIDCDICMGIPLSSSGKNIFFDR